MWTLSIDLLDSHKDKPGYIHWEGGYLKNLKRIKDMDHIGTKAWLRSNLDFRPFNEEHKILRNVEDAKDGHLWNGYSGKTRL